jgi:transcriptional regulator with XRE-family HTH domain
MPGSVIRQYREQRNYSQKWVASQMKISQNAYSKIENNLTQLTVHHLKQLSQILDIPMIDLLKDEFEIRRPVVLPKVAHKEDLLKHIENLKKCIENKKASTNEHYLVALSLIIAAENTLSEVH